MDMKEALNRIASNLDLSREEMKDVMRIVMNGEATDAQIGAFLMGLRLKSETIDEITGATEVMRELATVLSEVSSAWKICASSKSATANWSAK